VGTRSVLGVRAMRPTFLDNVPASREAQTCRARCEAGGRHIMTTDLALDDESDEDLDDDDDDFFDTDEDDDEDADDDDEEEDVETWQVHSSARISAKARPWLDFRF
jgi:hypothetical protein